MQDTSVGPVGSLSSVRDVGHSEEQQTEIVVSQEITLGSWRPKRLQNPLRELTKAGEPKRIMRRGKAPERLCCYVSSVARGTHSESSSSVRAVDQRGWRDAMVEYDSVMRGGVQEVIPRPERESCLTSRWIVLTLRGGVNQCRLVSLLILTFKTKLLAALIYSK